MLKWFINEHNASQAFALGRLLVCLVYHFPRGWRWVIMGHEQIDQDDFETRELAQAACEVRLKEILEKGLNNA